MLATLDFFVKYSQSYSETIRAKLLKEGFVRTTLSALIRTVVELGKEFSHGRWVETSIGKITDIINLSRSQTCRNLEKLVQAKIIEKVNKGRAGVLFRMLVVPETNKPHPGSYSAPVIEPEIKVESDVEAELATPAEPTPKSYRAEAVEIRLDEIEQSEGGFKKSRQRARVFLMNRMDDHEIELVLARDRERREQEKRRFEELQQRQQHEAFHMAQERDLEELYENLPEDQQRQIDEEALAQFAEVNRPLVFKNSILRAVFLEQRLRILRRRFSQRIPVGSYSIE